MVPTIIQVRGTSGSGKTWVMKQVMGRIGGWEPVYREGRRRPLYYLSEPRGEGRVAVLGAYETACGGCDGIGSAPAVYELTKEVAALPRVTTVLSEGLLLSEDTKWAGKLVEEGYGLRILFLATPTDRCLSQISSRRAEAGNNKPLNPDNTVNRVGVIERARTKLAGNGVVCRRCSASQAVEIALGWTERRK